MDRKNEAENREAFDYEKGTAVFETERCLVREIRLSDLPRLYEIYEGPGITDYLEPLYEWDEEVDYTRTYIRMIYGFYGYGMWVICDKATGELIGRIGFDDREVPDGSGGMRRILEFGYLIAAERQQKGLATETAKGALWYLFQSYEETKVTSLIEPPNRVSIRFAEKMGFLYRGSIVLSGKTMLEYELERKNAQKFLGNCEKTVKIL